jgi:hypothetical protein
MTSPEGTVTANVHITDLERGVIEPVRAQAAIRSLVAMAAAVGYVAGYQDGAERPTPELPEQDTLHKSRGENDE